MADNTNVFPWMEIGSKLADVALGQLTAKQQYERQKKLMDIQNQNQQQMMQKQMQNQMGLNEQGQALQMKTWADTNYPAQMEMIKKAGLNPAMLYSKGGMGGTTGGQGGGSASGGSASGGTAQMAQTGASIMELKNQMAQIDLTKALADKARAETPEIAPTAQKGREKMGAEAEASLASAEESRARTAGIKIANAYSPQQRETEINKQLEETKRIALENKWTAEQWQANKEMLSAQITGQLIRNEAEKTGIDLKNAEIEAISVKIAQEAERIMQTGRSLDQKDREIKIQEFKAQIDADYPGAWDVVGKVLNEAYLTLDDIYKYYDSALSTNKEYKKYNQLK